MKGPDKQVLEPVAVKPYKKGGKVKSEKIDISDGGMDSMYGVEGDIRKYNAKDRIKKYGEGGPTVQPEYPDLTPPNLFDYEKSGLKYAATEAERRYLQEMYGGTSPYDVGGTLSEEMKLRESIENTDGNELVEGEGPSGFTSFPNIAPAQQGIVEDEDDNLENIGMNIYDDGGLINTDKISEPSNPSIGLVANGEMPQADVDKYIKPQIIEDGGIISPIDSRTRSKMIQGYGEGDSNG